jgi:hypothetical protein
MAILHKDGKTYYVFPDAALNQAYIGGPKQYQAYRQLRLKRISAASSFSMISSARHPRSRPGRKALQ